MRNLPLLGLDCTTRFVLYSVLLAACAKKEPCNDLQTIPVVGWREKAFDVDRRKADCGLDGRWGCHIQFTVDTVHWGQTVTTKRVD